MDPLTEKSALLDQLSTLVVSCESHLSKLSSLESTGEESLQKTFDRVTQCVNTIRKTRAHQIKTYVKHCQNNLLQLKSTADNEIRQLSSNEATADDVTDAKENFKSLQEYMGKCKPSENCCVSLKPQLTSLLEEMIELPSVVLETKSIQTELSEKIKKRPKKNPHQKSNSSLLTDQQKLKRGLLAKASLGTLNQNKVANVPPMEPSSGGRGGLKRSVSVLLAECSNDIRKDVPREIISEGIRRSVPLAAHGVYKIIEDVEESKADRNEPLCVECSAEVSHVVSPSLFFFQRSADASKLKTLSQSINRVAQVWGVVDSGQQLKTGSLYLCMFTSDNRWYRALLLDITSCNLCEDCDKEMAEVFYVDYGNEECVHTDRLRSCPPTFQLDKIAPFAVASSLYNLEPLSVAETESWEEAALILFDELVTDGRVQVMVMGCTPVGQWQHLHDEYLNTRGVDAVCFVSVERIPSATGVSQDPFISVTEVLIHLNYAIAQQMIFDEELIGKKLVGREFFKPKVSYAPDEVLYVYLTHFDTPDDFYVQIDEYSHSHQYEDLHSEIQKFYKSTNENLVDWKVYLPSVGMNCIVRDSGNGVFYRAVIECVHMEHNKREVTVYYVDYGRKDRISIKDLRKIKDVYMNLPAQAIPCRLANVDPLEGEKSEWNPAVGKLVEGFIETLHQEKSYSAVIISSQSLDEELNRFVIKLFVHTDADSKIDLSRHLVNLGYAKFHHRDEGWTSCDANEITTQHLPQLNCFTENRRYKIGRRKRLANPVRREIKEVQVDPPSIGSKQSLGVTFLSLLSPHLIFVRLDAMTTNFRRLEEDLCNLFHSSASSCTKVSAVTRGKVYLAEEGKGPRRVKVIDVMTQQQSKVVYLDHGGVSVVKTDQLYSLPPRYCGLKPLALPVKLHDIIPPGGQNVWPGTSSDSLRELLQSLTSIYLLKQGDGVKSVEQSIRVLPCILGYVTEVTVSEPLRVFEQVQNRVSVSEHLIHAGLALPQKLRSEAKSFAPRIASSHTKSDTLLPHEELEELSSELKESHSSLKSSANQQKSAQVKWKKAHVELPSSFVGVPTYVDNEGVIYFHMQSCERALLMVSSALELSFKDSVPILTTAEDIQEGDFVVARYHLDRKWYRAQVTKVGHLTEVGVFFIDYGNAEAVNVRDLRYTEQFEDLAMQCHQCVLYDVLPLSNDNKWPTNVLDLLHVSVVDKRCQIKIIEKGDGANTLPQVEIIVSSNNSNVNKMFHRLRLCKESKLKSIVQSESSLRSVSEATEVSEDEDCHQKPLPFLRLPSSGSIFPVKVSSVVDPVTMYIMPQFVEGLEKGVLRELSKALQHQNYTRQIAEVQITAFGLPQVTKVYIGGQYLCYINYTHDWKRCEVISKLNPQDVDSITLKSAEPNEDIYQVILSDYGSREEIPFSLLRDMPPLLRSIPRQCSLLRLACVTPNEAHPIEEVMGASIETYLETTEQLFASVKSRGQHGGYEGELLVHTPSDVYIPCYSHFISTFFTLGRNCGGERCSLHQMYK